MSTNTRETIDINGISVEVRRKSIKNLHVGVYPPDGRVRVSAPLRFDSEAIRLAVVSRIGWIRRKRATFEAQVRQSEREMVTGESHFVLGRRYRLKVIEAPGAHHVRIADNSWLELTVRPGTDTAGRKRALERWYRDILRERIPALLDEWQPRLGVEVAEWRVKHMKTRWGSCNAEAKRIWLNSELAKKPESCLEYVLVHELAHLIERNHTDRFRALLDEFMPDWRLRRDELNRAPLAHEEWDY